MSFEEQVTRAFETLSDRLRGEIDEQVGRTAAELIAAAHADRQAAVSAQKSSDAASSARLIDAVQALDRARSLTELLETLVACARAEASSADIWLLRDGHLYPWPTRSVDAVEQSAPPIEQGAPLTVGGATVAYLFVEPRTTNAERLTTNVDLLVRYASRCLEALTAFKTAQLELRT